MKINNSSSSIYKIYKGANQTTTVGQNSTTHVSMQYSLFAGDIFETADKDITSKSSQMTKNATQSIETSSKEGNIIHNAQREVKNNSGEKTNSF